MPQTRGRLFDDVAQFMTDTASVMQGMRREVETLVRTQVERLLAGMDVVRRDEFEAMREMAALARDDAEALRRRIEVLEAQITAKPAHAPDAT